MREVVGCYIAFEKLVEDVCIKFRSSFFTADIWIMFWELADLCKLLRVSSTYLLLLLHVSESMERNLTIDYAFY